MWLCFNCTVTPLCTPPVYQTQTMVMLVHTPKLYVFVQLCMWWLSPSQVYLCSLPADRLQCGAVFQSISAACVCRGVSCCCSWRVLPSFHWQLVQVHHGQALLALGNLLQAGGTNYELTVCPIARCCLCSVMRRLLARLSLLSTN